MRETLKKGFVKRESIIWIAEQYNSFLPPPSTLNGVTYFKNLSYPHIDPMKQDQTYKP